MDESVTPVVRHHQGLLGPKSRKVNDPVTILGGGDERRIR
jgi:hypothetical protein